MTILKTETGFYVMRSGRSDSHAVILGRCLTVAAARQLIDRDKESFMKSRSDFALVSLLTWKGDLTEDEKREIKALEERGRRDDY